MQGEQEYAFDKNISKAVTSMVKTKKKWNTFKIGQAVSISRKEEKKIIWHDGIVISKNKYHMSIKCKNRVETIRYADLIVSMANKMPLIRIVRGVESTEIIK